LFPGTVRDNLDPHGVFDNYSLLRVLDKTGLIKTLANRFKSTTAEPMLDMPLFSADSHKCILSAGERFLLAVARLLLQRYSILAIDDGISLLDLDHAQLVFNVLRKEYAMTTLLIVSARIHDVLGCERIIVMDSGTIEEFDKPTTLVDKNGKFMRLIKASA
ncbi:P-loop containing nucleoside triphosphate hydrolase protein, partial [Ramicandelaber brevisporus]